VRRYHATGVRRLLFNFVVLVSLVLLALTLRAWVKSHRSPDVRERTKWEIKGQSVFNWCILVLSSAGELEIACDAEVSDRQAASL
jgi:hypothetical protein